MRAATGLTGQFSAMRPKDSPVPLVDTTIAHAVAAVDRALSDTPSSTTG